MKHFIYVLFSLLIFTSCEDKININLPAADSQLAVDGKVFAYFYTDFIKPLKGYQPQKIRLTLTNGYGAGQVPLVDNAVVSLTDTKIYGAVDLRGRWLLCYPNYGGRDRPWIFAKNRLQWIHLSFV
mgnify:CR=1 FL=1